MKKKIKKNRNIIPKISTVTSLDPISEVSAHLENTNVHNTNEDQEIRQDMSEFFIIDDDLNQSTLSDSKNTAQQEDLNKAQLFEPDPEIISPTQEIKKTGYFASLVKKAKSLLGTKGQGRQ